MVRGVTFKAPPARSTFQLDDTVTDWGSGTFSLKDMPAESTAEPPHQLEQAVRRELMNQPTLKFSSLVVRRMPNGVCLEGVVESIGSASDIGQIVNTVAGVDRVVNRLVVRNPAPKH